MTLLARKGVAKIACRCRSQNKIRNGVDVARTVLDIDTIKRFGAIDEFSVPEGCTVSLKVFNDPEAAEKYIRGL